jgi:hypothetical protein
MDTSARAQERFNRLPWQKQLYYVMLMLGMLAVALPVMAMHEAMEYFRREE